MKNLLFITIILLSNLLSNAQTGRTCGTMDVYDRQLLANPNMQSIKDAIETHTAAYTAIHSGKKIRTIVTIPIVFHVMYNTAAENISDAQCIAQIAQLNIDFARLNTDSNNTPIGFRPIAANTQIQFCLAVRDPNGQATTGILHKATTATSFIDDDKVKANATAGDNPWPASDYLNIWTCNLGANLLGYAQFPGGPAASDGVVALYSTIGSMASSGTNVSFGYGRTCTHEVGHYLNLYHTFQSGCTGLTSANCTTGGDRVCDTPPVSAATYNCPATKNTCTETTPFPPPYVADQNDMTMNFMDYVDDACMNLFTNGQGVRMQSIFAVGGSRASLLNSLGCLSLAPCTGTPTAGTITATADTLCGSATSSLSLAGYSTTAGTTIQWQQSPNGTSGWTNIANTTDTYIASAVPTVQYYRCVVTCSSSALFAYSNVKAIYANGVINVNGDTVCTAGPISLQAFGIGTFNWYANATATTPIFTGNPFNTSITADSTFYVNTGTSTAYTVGAVDASIGSTTITTNFGGGIRFKALTDLTIDSVFAYPGAAGNIVVLMQDTATNTTVASYTLAVTAAQAGTRVKIPVNFTCTAGIGYNLLATGSTCGNLLRNNAGSAFPYVVPNVIALTRNAANTTAGRYYFFYNWYVHAGCGTAKIPVAVHIGGPTVIATASGILCNGGITTITATGTGISYNLNNGSNNATGIFTNNAVGTYTIKATDANGCSKTTSITLSQPNALAMTVASTSAIGCNGSITATVTGGTTPYSYSNNGGASQSSSVFGSLCVGSYTLCATDANGCVKCSNAVVANSTGVALTAITTATCGASNNGTITINGFGGTTPYTYKLNAGAYQTLNVYTGLAAGTYTLTLKDANNITGTITATIAASAIAITTTSIVNSATNNCTGSATVAVTGGSGTINYSANGGASQTNNILTNLCNNTSYTICASDANGCSICTTAIIGALPNLAFATGNIVQACPAQTNGSINLPATGGLAPINYSINNGPMQASSVFSALTIGIYTIQAKDANNNTISSVVALNQSALLNVTATIASALKCNGTCDAIINTTAAQGLANYSYNINGGASQTTGAFTNICAGNYTINAIDANACGVSTIIVITQPLFLNTVATVNSVPCTGGLGSITATTTGGVATYNYAINNGTFSATNTFSNLAAGTYTITTNDINGCTTSNVSIVTTAANLGATTVTTAVTSGNNGSITVNVNGGIPPYNYSINNGPTQTGNVFSNLSIGTYTILAKDSRGCSIVLNVSINFPENLYENALQNIFKVYPNPAHNYINVNINAQENIGTVQLQIVDAQGKIVTKEMVNVLGQSMVKKMDISHLAAGNYTLLLMNEKHEYGIQKFMVK